MTLRLQAEGGRHLSLVQDHQGPENPLGDKILMMALHLHQQLLVEGQVLLHQQLLAEGQVVAGVKVTGSVKRPTQIRHLLFSVSSSLLLGVER